MPRVSWGRRARLYISDTSFGSDDLIVVTKAKDIASIDEAAQQTATARDIDYEISGKGAKTVRVEFGKLFVVGANAGDTLLLRTAYVNDTELYCVLLRDLIDVASGDGIRFLANVQQFPEELPENEAASTQIVLSMTDVEGDGVFFERVESPYFFNPSAGTDFRRSLLEVLPLADGVIDEFDRRHLLSYERLANT
jgi:hypothetical protein